MVLLGTASVQTSIQWNYSRPLMRVSLTDIIMHMYFYVNYEIYGPFNVDCCLMHSFVHAGFMILFKHVTVVFSYKVASAVICLSNTSL